MKNKDFSKYIGIPFKSQGRDARGIDCYGLVRLVLRNEFDKELPDFYYPTANDKSHIDNLVNINRPLLAGRETKRPVPGNVVVMRYLGKNCHLGVYLGSGRILHIKAGTASIIERAASPILKSRIEGYYAIS